MATSSSTTALLTVEIIAQFEIESRFFEGKTIEVKRDSEGEEKLVEWQFEEELGHGAFGDVTLERDVASGNTRAVKMIKKTDEKTLDHRKELLALSSLSKHNVCFVTFHGYFENPHLPRYIYFAMEYFPCGDLFKYLSRPENAPCTEEDAKHIASQLLFGIKIMHSLGYAHRDIKPQNIFVVQRYPFWWLKLGDFGIAKRVVDDQTELRTRIGTPYYRAPEVGLTVNSIYKGSYTPAVDMWSLGFVLYWVLTKTLPFDVRGDPSEEDFVRNLAVLPTERLNQNGVTDIGITFVKQLIAADARDRLTAEQALEHLWLKDVVSSAETIEEAIEQTREKPKISPDDFVIAVLGPTGTGKSAFISNFSVAPLPEIGDGLTSLTREITAHRCQYKGENIVFVDSPGFDDTNISDTEVLREISTWLANAHEKKIQLAGMLYLHRISDPRVSGTSMRNIKLLKKLVGLDASGLVIVTTFWDVLSESTGKMREKELREQFFRTMLSHGAIIRANDDPPSSAQGIVDYLLANRRQVVLDIQRQMIDEAMSLEATPAGLQVSGNNERATRLVDREVRELQEELDEAIHAKDERLQKEIAVMSLELQDRMKRHAAVEEKLKISHRDLQRQLDAKWEWRWEKLLDLLRRTEATLIEEELALTKAEHSPAEIEQMLSARRQQKKLLIQRVESYRQSECIVM